jgi:hypothetical protein
VALGQRVVELRRRLGHRHDEAEVDEQLQRRRGPVLLVGIAPLEGEREAHRGMLVAPVRRPTGWTTSLHPQVEHAGDPIGLRFGRFDLSERARAMPMLMAWNAFGAHGRGTPAGAAASVGLLEGWWWSASA